MICNCNNPILSLVGVELVHWKASFFEIAPREYAALTFRVKGTASIKVDNKTYSVHENEVLYLPQGVAYTAEYDDNEILAIHFKTQSDDKEAEIYSLANSEEIHQAFLKAHEIWKNKEPGYEANVLSHLYWVFAKLCGNTLSEKLPPHFTKALSYINLHYKDSALCAGNICKNAGISQTTLRTLFKKYYQKTPTEYITQLRIEYARSLISCGTPIEQAAEKSGFNDSKYFARVVKKHLHCTPRELKSYGK
ncbi:MAG: helix-turn-helix domain-containing protein [Clostridia bacterium]|nr:helix-turn-helix domain-containing protein [Clostridia bacterium]